MTYYNDNDPACCEWLRELIAVGHIPAGDVDSRSITDIKPDELKAYTQTHFFAGIGGWPIALRLAGWPDDRPVGTGSCPCQPLSCAGKGQGELDARHLWPAFFPFIAELGISVWFGEQVASKDGLEWIAGVRADLEDAGHAVGIADLPAACIGSPNIRQRLFWCASRLAQPEHAERRSVNVAGQDGCDRPDARRTEAHSEPGACSEVCRLGDTVRKRWGKGTGQQGEIGCPGSRKPESTESNSRLDNAAGPRLEGQKPEFQQPGQAEGRLPSGPGHAFYASSRFIACADGRTRRIPAEPELFPLVNGIPSRVGPLLTALQPMGRSAIKAARRNYLVRLKAYGNAINPLVAAAFIETTGLLP